MSGFQGYKMNDVYLCDFFVVSVTDTSLYSISIDVI